MKHYVMINGEWHQVYRVRSVWNTVCWITALGAIATVGIAVMKGWL